MFLWFSYSFCPAPKNMLLGDWVRKKKCECVCKWVYMVPCDLLAFNLGCFPLFSGIWHNSIINTNWKHRLSQKSQVVWNLKTIVFIIIVLLNNQTSLQNTWLFFPHRNSCVKLEFNNRLCDNMLSVVTLWRLCNSRSVNNIITMFCHQSAWSWFMQKMGLHSTNIKSELWVIRIFLLSNTLYVYADFWYQRSDHTEILIKNLLHCQKFVISHLWLQWD